MAKKKRHHQRTSERERAELEQVRKAHRGVLRADDVWRWAKARPSSALHKRFKWNVHKAAELYWREQAQQLIMKVYIERPEGYEEETRVRAYVSLPSDRKKGGGQLRRIEDVMASRRLRDELFASALAELTAFRNKYAALKELARVMKVIDETLKKR